MSKIENPMLELMMLPMRMTVEANRQMERQMLEQMMFPVRASAEVVKDRWREQRDQHLEELGLPPKYRKE